jgi:poly-gamma-glutamate capsule biosynthesis protein CapA/YwtB (metallophosphatase superfamily)
MPQSHVSNASKAKSHAS